jgi:hypothetical protein
MRSQVTCGRSSSRSPGLHWEPADSHEVGNTAIDEGCFVGMHTGELPGPAGEAIPPTGKKVRVRECDAATVENGVITSHRFSFDQMELLGQLGLLPSCLTGPRSPLPRGRPFRPGPVRVTAPEEPPLAAL